MVFSASGFSTGYDIVKSLHILAAIIGFPEEAARLQFERRKLHWQGIDEHTVTQQQETADFYHAHGLMTQRLDVTPTFAKGFSVPAD